MAFRGAVALVALALAACSSKSSEPAESDPLPGAVQPALTMNDAKAPDAAFDDVVGDDGSVVEPITAPTPGPRYRPASAARRVIEITLRSTPPGAAASVDGVFVGVTPTYWRGVADGRRREFTFVMSDYRMARYRFVPTTSGVVHGRLEPLDRSGARADAGLGR